MAVLIPTYQINTVQDDISAKTVPIASHSKC